MMANATPSRRLIADPTGSMSRCDRRVEVLRSYGNYKVPRFQLFHKFNGTFCNLWNRHFSLLYIDAPT